MSKEKQILDSAREVAASVETWVDLSNALFDPEEGLVARAFPTRQEREDFSRRTSIAPSANSSTKPKTELD